MALFRPNVKKLTQSRDVQSLVELLGHGKESTRLSATNSLSKIDHPRLVPLVLAALEHPIAGPLATEVIAYRASVGKEDVGVPELLAVLDSGHAEWRNRLLAAEALVRFGDPAGVERAINPLLSSLVEIDLSPALRTRVASALGNIDPAVLDPGQTTAAVASLGAVLDTGVEGSGEIGLVGKALFNLGDEKGTARAAALLQARLKEGDPGERAAAAKALGQIGTPAAVDTLLPALQDADYLEVKRAVREALTTVGAPGIRAAFQGREAAMGPQTLIILAEMGDMTALEELIAVLFDESKSQETRTQVAEMLQDFGVTEATKATKATEKRAHEALRIFRGTKAAVPLLVRVFVNEVFFTDKVLAAGENLAEFGVNGLEPLLEALGDVGMLERYRAIAPMSDDEAKLLIVELTGKRMREIEERRQKVARDMQKIEELKGRMKGSSWS